MAVKPLVPLAHREYPLEEMQRRVAAFAAKMARRRSVRDFSPCPVPRELIGRPKNERAFLNLVVGYPAENARVPDLSRKRLAEIATFR